MTDTDKKAEILKVVASMAEDLKEVVDEIENNSSQVTQYNYDRYLTVIHELSNGNKTTGMLVALALIQAGANNNGVRHAMKVAYG